MSYRDSEDGNSNPKNLETAVEDVLEGEEYTMQDTVPRTAADESVHERGLERHVFDDPASAAAGVDEPLKQSVDTMEDVENHLDEAYMSSVEISSIQETNDSLHLGLSANLDGYDIPLPGTISIKPSDREYTGE